MLLYVYVLRVEGRVNGIFALIPQVDYRVEGAAQTDEDRIKEVLRYDREQNLIGMYVPDKNPSQDPSVVRMYYTPSMARQQLYASGFPINMGPYNIIDAFVCLGSRFGLDPLQVYVELCRSDFGEGMYWANVYYVATPELPACVIKAEKHLIMLDTDEVLKRIASDHEDEMHFHKQMNNSPQDFQDKEIKANSPQT